MEQWETECEQAQADRLAHHAFEHEVEGYGIADGMTRQPADLDYAHEPAYLIGHRQGMALPEVHP